MNPNQSMVEAQKKSDLAVVFLAWRGHSAGCLRDFLHSYHGHDAGIPHQLVLVLKGMRKTEPDVAELVTSAMEDEAIVIEIEDEGVDLWAYLKILKETNYRRLVFLNSKSRILCGGWLRKMSEALDDPLVGMVGAFGSWETGMHDTFPNPCIRTNGFMADRDMLLNLDWGAAVIDRETALLLESGPKSLTRQVTDKSLVAKVVDSSGKSHPWQSWPSSRTFRSHDQEKLLIADNRSDQYAQATERQREWLRCYAWTRSRPPNPYKYTGVAYWLRVFRYKILNSIKLK